MQETREHIKTRMLKNAARIWGYPETEAENSFDPVVAMLLAACSVELEKISSDIHSSRARVLEKLIQLLSPDTLTGPLPAHAIGCATPVENKAEVQQDTRFYIPGRKRASKEDEQPETKDIFFAPTNSFRLNKATVRFMAAGTRLIGQGLDKQVLACSRTGTELPASTLWIGIDEPGVSLHDTSFYFGFRDELKKKLFYHALPHARWHTGDTTLQHQAGYGKREISGENLDLKRLLNNQHSIHERISKQVNAFYKSQFITLSDENQYLTEKSSCIPEAFYSCFITKDLESLQQQPLRWINIRFPENISGTMLQDVVCTMNCFPVVNQRLHQLQHRMQELINIIPLETDDLFFDIDTVQDDANNAIAGYTPKEEEDVACTMLMRNGGVGRFDERDAAATINHLLQLLKDESAAFSALSHDFISNEIKQLRQTINRLEQKLTSSQALRDTTPYLFVRNSKKNPVPHIFINYWSTAGKKANQLKAGTPLQLYKGTLVTSQARLVSTTAGGRDKLGATESILAYKSALLSRDRIVTPEDIRSFCQYQLGDGVKKIEIQKGTQIHPGEQQGYITTLDVRILLYANAYAELEKNGACSFWEERLTHLLEERAAALVPYRVSIQTS